MLFYPLDLDLAPFELAGTHILVAYIQDEINKRVSEDQRRDPSVIKLFYGWDEIARFTQIEEKIIREVLGKISNQQDGLLVLAYPPDVAPFDRGDAEETARGERSYRRRSHIRRCNNDET